ncbi:MAG: DUF4402 domain-containing protein [Pseudomonadota bacterium]
MRYVAGLIGFGRRLKLCALGFGLACSNASTAETSVTGHAGAQIIEPLMVMAWEELDFGTIAPNSSFPGIVTVHANETRDCSTEVTCVGSAFSAARFMVTGEADHIYDISVPTDLMIENSLGDTMLIDNLYSDRSQGLLTGGVDEFWVGGDLHIGANQAIGSYTGVYVVSVQYQ